MTSRSAARARQVGLLARDPLAVVVELGLQPLERVEVLVALALEPLEASREDLVLAALLDAEPLGVSSTPSVDLLEFVAQEVFAPSLSSTTS